VWLWFFPDLGLALSVFALLYCLLVFDGSRKLFRDSDSGWHIRTGEMILAAGSLPRTDPYSFTRQGQPWFAWEWGADVVMGAVHGAFGLSGVAFVFAAAIAAGVWLWFRLHWAVHGDFLLACLMISPMLSTTNLHWLARPHVFSWLFLLAALIVAERAPDRFRAWHGILIAAFAAAWANFHASFFFAPFIALVYAAGAALRPMVWNDERGGGRRARWFLWAAGCALLGSLVNPYGWQLHRHIASYLGDSALLARVGEFQSFNFHVGGSWQILLTVGLAGCGTVLAILRGRLDHFLLGALLIALGLRSARGLPVVALALLPLANGAITEALRRASGLRQGLAAWRDKYFAYTGRLREIDARMSGLAWAPVALLLAFVALRTPAVAARTGFPPDEFPVEAAAFVEKLPASARLLAPDKYGGYLIYRFEGRRKVFMDGRSDFYGLEFMKRYIDLVELRAGWRETVDYFRFSHALLPKNYALVPALEREGWKRLHADRTSVLLER
jgi:hypothetical protein